MNDQVTVRQADLDTMTPDEIETARAKGRFAVLLDTPLAEVELLTRARSGQIALDDVDALAVLNRHDLIESARAENRITLTTKENRKV